MKLKHHVIHLLGIMICCLGFLYQCHTIISEYLIYGTRLETEPVYPWALWEPGISACFRIMDILNTTQLEFEKNVTILRQNHEKFNYQDYYKNLSKLTIADIFNSTPHQSDILTSDYVACTRRSDTYHTLRQNKTECLLGYDTSRYIHRMFMCYMFIPKIPIRISNWKVQRGIDHFGIIANFHFNKAILNDTVGFSFYEHDKKSNLFSDSALAVYMKRRNRESASFFLSAYRIIEAALPSPYSSNCAPHPKFGSSSARSLHFLGSKITQKMGKVPTITMIFDQKIKLPMLTNLDYYNTTFIDTVRQEIPKLIKSSKKVCESEYLVPSIKFKNENDISVHIQWHNLLGFTFKQYAKQVIIDVIIYLCSSLGVWLGLSAYSLFGTYNDIVKQRLVEREKMRSKFKLVELLLELSRLNHIVGQHDIRLDEMSLRRHLRRRR